MNFFLLNSSYFDPLIFDLSESHWAFHLSPLSLRITFSSSLTLILSFSLFLPPQPPLSQILLHVLTFHVFLCLCSIAFKNFDLDAHQFLFYHAFYIHSMYVCSTFSHVFFLKLNIKVRCSNFKLLSLAYIAVFAHTV